MVQSNFRNDILQFKFNWLAILIFALAFCLFANATVIPDNTTIVGDLTVQSTNGIDINPGSDTTTDLISIGVTGSPKIKWNETQDAIQFIEKLILGTNAILSKTVNGSAYTSKMSLDTDTSTDSGGIDINIHGSSDPSYGVLSVLRSRGTHASQSIVQSGDLISSIVGLGYDGVDYEPAASIEMYSDGTPGSNDMPGRIDFKTVPDGSRTLTNVMRIGQRSDVMIGTTTSNSSAIFNVESTTKGSRPSPQMTTTQRDAIGTPVTGLSVYNTTLNSYDFYNGTSWLNLLDTSTFQEFSNKTVSGIFKFEESGGGSNYIGFQAPASVTSDVTFQWPDGDGTSGQALKTDGAGTLSWGNASGGSGAQNYIENPDAEVDTTGYAVYADAAGTSPVNGTGGSGNITWTRSTSSPLRSTASFLLTKDAVNRQGEGVSYDFSVDTADQAKVMQISFDYIVSSGTFVAGTSSTSSDVTVWIYDVTNSVLIQPSSFKLLSNSSTTSDKFNATFQTASNSTSYRLIFHVGSTSASAYVLKFDSIAVSPSTYVYGTPITDWSTNWTPTGSWSTNTTYTGKWRRIGDSMELDVSLTLAGAPTAAGLTVNMPSGYTIDTTKISATTGGSTPILGIATSWDSGTTIYQGYVTYNSTTSVIVYANGASSTYTNAQQVSNTVPMTWASGDVQSLKFSVPILGWSSSVQTSDQTDTRVVAARYTTNAAQSISNASNTIIDFEDKDFDTHNATTIGASWKYTAQVPGIYSTSASITSTSTGNFSGTEYIELKIYKNGSFYSSKYLSNFTGSSVQIALSHSDEINLVAGDYIDFRVYQTSGSSLPLDSAAGYNFVSVKRLSGLSAIAATESISFAAHTSTTAATTSAPFIYTVKEHDTHGSYSTSTGKFTAPSAGKYAFQLVAYCGATVVSATFNKNGSTVVGRSSPTTASNYVGTGQIILSLVAGDTIEVRPDVNATATTGSTLNTFSGMRVGN